MRVGLCWSWAQPDTEHVKIWWLSLWLWLLLCFMQWKSPADPFEPEVLLWHTAGAQAGFPPAHAAPIYQLQLLTLLKLLISPLLLFSHIKPALKFSKTLRAHPQLTWSKLAQWMALDSEHCEVWGLKMERPQTLLFCTKIHIRQLIKCI